MSSEFSIDDTIEPDVETTTSVPAPAVQMPQVQGNITTEAPTPGGNAGGKTGGIFTLNHYSWLFDVDSWQVKDRILISANPLAQKYFIKPELETGNEVGSIAGGNPDLYGPFWICTTVIFVLFFTNTFVGLVASSWQGRHYEYKFGLLTASAGLLYSYTFLVPLALWLIIRYLNVSPSTSFLQLVSLYGYSNAIWVPVFLTSILTVLFGSTTLIANIIQWVLIAVGFGLSGWFIVTNISRISEADPNSQRIFNPKLGVVVVALLHVGLAVGIKFLCFGGIKVQ